MNHPPKQLALLISLIGAGVSPYAQAHLAGRAGASPPAWPGAMDAELGATRLQSADDDAAAERIWLPAAAPGSALDPPRAQGVALLYHPPGDEWAPGESPGTQGDALGEWLGRESAARAAARAATTRLAAATLSEVRKVSRQAGRRFAAKARTVRTLAPTPALTVGAASIETDALRPLARLAPSSVPSTTTATATATATATTATTTAAAAVIAPALVALPNGSAPAASPHIDRLLDTLAAVLNEAPAKLTPDAPDAHAASLRSAAPTATAAASRPLLAEPPADKVMRQLGAILSPEGPGSRDRRGGAADAVDGVASAAAPAVEDGAARRLRKLAARAAKEAQAAEAQQASAAHAALQQGEVDLLLPLAPAPSVAAAPAAPARRASPFGGHPVAVAESALDRVRGGFDSGGLNVSFGIARAVYINGALVTTTTLNVSDLGQLSAGRAGASIDAGTISLIQNGVGNAVASGTFSAASAGTIVQNTLDGQQIQNVTVINATANSLGVLRSINLTSSLRGAVIDSLRR